MAIRDWPADDRPREKLLMRGPGALSDAELLAVLLRTGVRGQSALDLARALLSEHGGLRGLLAAPAGRLAGTRGLGPAKYAQLQAALELARRHLGERLLRGEPLTDPDATRRYLIARLRDLPHEVFGCLYLDTRHRVLGFEELFRGTLDGASVHPREVVKAALARNAAALILAHNHPSGVAEPSEADRQITRRLREALGLVDIRLLDHFVIGDGCAVSFAERGLL
ncbi:MAG TPA: DNA repair protein RadC [Gammaproteobacteria bacterium]|nr:DNA repair protein RadC [Gammaproteobacteria bacterium]